MIEFDDALEGYLAWCRVEKGLSVHTVEAYYRDLSDLQGFMLGIGLSSMSAGTEELRQWMLDLTDRGLGRRTIARRRVAMRQFYRFLVAESVIAHSPAELIDGPSTPRKLPQVLSQKQVEAILAQPDRSHLLGMRDAAMLELLYATGLRVTELVRLKKSAWNDGWLIVRGKGGKERIVPYGDNAGELVQLYLARRRDPTMAVSDQTRRTDDPSKLLGR